jgi:Fic family protein
MMAHYVEGVTAPNPTAASKAERVGIRYRAYVPDRIGDRAYDLSSDQADGLVRAEVAIRELQGHPTAQGLEQLARQLLRAESVGSSRIEGLVLSQQRLFKAIFDPTTEDQTARSILGNIRAMEAAIELGSRDRDITFDDLVGMHRELLDATTDRHLAGVVRTQQNWIGGSTIAKAEFVPPPHTELPNLLEDLCTFINRDDIPAVQQAAIAHAQYETIHPHIDGNGRVGRCLIHVVFKRRGLTPSFVPPISLVLATNSARYISGLSEYRRGMVGDWVQLFATTAIEASEQAQTFADNIAAAQASWLERAGNPRRDSAAARLIPLLPANPVLDVSSAADLLGISTVAARLGLVALENAGIIKETSVSRYRRGWAAKEVFTMLDGFERILATPAESARTSRPAPGAVRSVRL